jgi:hypothetical protein
MKKGINYVPLFLIVLANLGFSIYSEAWYSMTAWLLCLSFLCEIYYLRFIK